MLYAQVFQNITGSFWQKIKYRTRQEDISTMVIQQRMEKRVVSKLGQIKTFS